jgi:hypothetical protein
MSDVVDLKDGIPTLVDRTTGLFLLPEGLQLDYKREMRIDSAQFVSEIARDVLAFSNSDGGLLVLGVADSKTVVGHDLVDARKLRDYMGPYIGTRVVFDVAAIQVNIQGTAKRLVILHVRRSLSAYPNLLRKDISLRPGLVRKLKYLEGTLFYRVKDESFSEPPYGDVDARARELRFNGAAPRTRTSFLLQEDKPGLRLYAPINDKFFGRETELNELMSKFDDPRGRGVSIAGFGGVGKTELAIKLVSDLYHRGKFRSVYSASAKQTLLGPAGVQQTDPVFIDLKSFLADLAGWLGLNLGSRTQVAEVSRQCLAELRKDSNRKILLFIDNLETVSDRRLLDFLDKDLPLNCWIVATGRVHKVRSFVYPKELRELDPDDAARLLRYELKRQGLEESAALHISELKAKAETLYLHPLAIRWFAWACKKTPAVWDTGIASDKQSELEAFCVAHTLGSLDQDAQKLLGAILAISDTAESTAACIQQTSGIADHVVEVGLWELECSGLILAGTDQEGVTTYTVAPLAETPASELSRKLGWESEFVHNLRFFVRKKIDNPESPLVRDLLKIEPRRIQEYTRDELIELDKRIARGLDKSSPRQAIKLNWIRAECQRHLENLVTADDLYRTCAENVVAADQMFVTQAERSRILLEAATVARLRAQSEPQLRRAIQYLSGIQQSEVAPMRVLGMLTEFHAILGDANEYKLFAAQATKYKEEHQYINSDSLDDALARAEAQMQRRLTRAR